MLYNQTLPKPGDVVGRKYRIVSSIGAGGMGVVFEAINVDTEGPVALKWLSPELSSSAEAVNRFKIEAKATGRIHHPNVVAIHDIGEHDGSIYLVMELLKGGSLRARLERGPLSVAEACQMLFPVMRGVAAAHAVKVLHRDLKPDNIFLAESPDGLEAIPKVLDFGIAKLCSDSEKTSPVSAKTTMMGTYQYMAFEQLHGRKDLDERVDVYALGSVLYITLTGYLPYQADNPVDLALQMLQSEAPPITQHVASLPAALAEVVSKALARDRANRYANVDQLALALEPFAHGVRYKGLQHNAAARGSVPDGGPGQPALTAASAAALATPFVVSPAAGGETTVPGRPKASARKRRGPWRLVLGAAAVGAVGWAGLVFSGASGRLVAPLPPAPPSSAASPAQQDQNGAVPASALPVARVDAGSSHVDEWDTPSSAAVRVGVPPQTPSAVPARPDAPAVDARASQAPASDRRRARAARVATVDAGAPSSVGPPAAAAPKPGGRYGEGLDMTELPTPSWARDPTSKHDGKNEPAGSAKRR